MARLDPMPELPVPAAVDRAPERATTAKGQPAPESRATVWATLAIVLLVVVAMTPLWWRDAQGAHLSYDFDRCLRLCEDAGFKGLYLVEQWSRKEQPVDAEKIADWMLARTRNFLRGASLYSRDASVPVSRRGLSR